MRACENCKQEGTRQSVPFIVYEAKETRNERTVKRLWIALIIAILANFMTNIAWLAYESQFETVTYSYEQDGEGTNIIGSENEVLYGSETQNQNS